MAVPTSGGAGMRLGERVQGAERSGTTRVSVTVTFLRMDRPPQTPPRAFPPGVAVLPVPRPTAPFYRYLYNTVGAAHLWWLRRTASDAAVEALLADPAVRLHVLYRDAAPAGFFELDGRGAPDVNLSYFGLLPHAIGLGLGRAFLRAAVDAGWAARPRALTVNTCTADHPRALPAYIDAGFVPLRAVREQWDVPRHLDLAIPEHLR